MLVGQVLRKYNPKEWGGTETALKSLLEGLQRQDVKSIVFCPKTEEQSDESNELNCEIKRFNTVVPVWNLTPQQKQLLVSIGGNLLSYDLPWKLYQEPNLSLIHTHALNRLGAAASLAAKLRHIPLVVTIHGGYLDLPQATQAKLAEPLKGGMEWGKAFGWLLGSRKLLNRADAILTCNKKEAALLRVRFPEKKVIVQPHAVNIDSFAENHLNEALVAFPQLKGKKVILVAARIDPIKNQKWLVEQMPAILKKNPETFLVLAGSCTDEKYGDEIRHSIKALHIENTVLLTGGFAPKDPRLIGLFQIAKAVVVPSLSETFGLSILEAWAAKVPVIASATSGAKDLLRHGENGWLFDLEHENFFHTVLNRVLDKTQENDSLILLGQETVKNEYCPEVLSAKVKTLYETLIEEKRKGQRT